MQAPQFQAQRPQVQQPQVQQMQGSRPKNLLGSLTSLGMGIATGNPMQAVSGGLGLMGVNDGGATQAMVDAGGGDTGDTTKKKKSTGEGDATKPADQPQEMPSVFQPFGQMLDPMHLLMAMAQQPAPNMMNSMQTNPSFGPQQQQQPQIPQQPAQWGKPSQFWSGGW